MIFFCNIWKDGISFFQNISYFFFRRKMKEDDLYQKTRGNMIFSVCMRRRIRRGITPLAKKKRCPEKNTPKGDILGITKKDDIHPRFILDSSYFCWYTTFIDTLVRAQEASTGDVPQEKLFLEISQNSQGKTCDRASFFLETFLERFYILLSSERKAGNLIYRTGIWLLLQFLWLEISSQKRYFECVWASIKETSCPLGRGYNSKNIRAAVKKF